MYYIMRNSYYVMHKVLRYAKNVLRYAVIITLCANYYVMWRHSEHAFVHFYLILDRVPKLSTTQSLHLYNPFNQDTEISRN